MRTKKAWFEVRDVEKDWREKAPSVDTFQDDLKFRGYSLKKLHFSRKLDRDTRKQQGKKRT